MKGIVKIKYDGVDVFSDIPSPFLYFDKEYIKYGSDWGSRYKITIEGNILAKPGRLSFDLLEARKDQLIASFLKDCAPLEIYQDDIKIFEFDVCFIESIDFQESKYHAILPFSISITCYDSNEFGANYGILEPSDSWDYKEGEDGIITLTHSISAKGFSSDVNSAIRNAKNWVSSRTGLSNKIDSLNISNIDSSNYCLKSFSEEIDRTSGSYSVNEEYAVDSLSESGGFGILRYATEVEKNFESGITTVTISGSVSGRRQIGENSLADLKSFIANYDFFSKAADAASSLTNKLNQTPFSSSIDERIEFNEISFSFSYDDNEFEVKCVSNVDVSENLIKNTVEVSLSSEISCERGDQSVRWNKVKEYYDNKFFPDSVAKKGCIDAGYSAFSEKIIFSNSRSENVSFNEREAIISYSSTWNTKLFPCPDLVNSVSERVEYTPSIKILTAQPSIYVSNEHNVQDFSTYTRASVSISVSCSVKKNKNINSALSCLKSEMNRLRGIYVIGGEIIIDEYSEDVNENTRSVSISASYSFNDPNTME